MAKNKTKRMHGFPGFVRHFWPILRKQKKLILVSFLALFGEIFLRLIEPWPLKFVIDLVILGESSGSQISFNYLEELEPMTLVTYAAIGIVVIVGLRALSTYLNKVGFALIGNRLLTEIRSILYRHIQCLSLSFHNKARSGDLIVRVVGDVGLLKEVAVTAILPLIGNVFVFTGMISVMFYLNWKLALISITMMPLFWISTTRKSRAIKEVSRKQKKRESAMASTVSESIGAIKVIQALSLDEAFSEEFSGQNDKSLKEGVKAKRLAAGLVRTVEVLIAIATAIVLWYGTRLVLKNDLSPGELIVFLSYLKSAFKPLRNFAKFTGRLSKASAAAERVIDILEEEPDIYDLPGAIEAPPLVGEIYFKEVDYSYESKKQVLDKMSFNISSGKRIALVGTSGSGKSTLISLILRLYDPTSGKVLIDGRDVREYKIESLRRQISVVLQDTLLFADTVWNNIAYGSPNATPREIDAAARMANAHEFIKMLPDGYDTVLGERGVTLSSGQRQRIAIARAAIRNAPILILDEPTTGLDSNNESLVMDALEKISKGKTTLLITHNLEQASHVDWIMYIENGTLLENGTHSELMQKNGKYAFFYKMQQCNIKEDVMESNYAIGR